MAGGAHGVAAALRQDALDALGGRRQHDALGVARIDALFPSVVMNDRDGRHLCPSSWCDRDGKAFEPPQRVVVAPLHGSGDLETFDLARKGSEHDLAFEPRHQLTDTHMNAGTEADMSRRLAGDVVSAR